MKQIMGIISALLLLSGGGALAQGTANTVPGASQDPAQPEYQIVQVPEPANKSQAKDQQILQNAVVAFKAGRLADAEAQLRGVEQKSPNNVTVHNLLGYIYLKENKSTDALTEMQSVVRLAPNDPAGRKNLGRAYLQVGKNDLAIAQFQAILAKTPNDTEALYGLGLALGQTGHSAEAASAFQKVVAITPSSKAYQNLAVTLQKSGRMAEAADAFQQAANLDPKNAVAFLNAGFLYAQAGNNDKAIPALTQALALDTDYKYEAHMALGQAYEKSDADKAIEQFAAAAQVRPTETEPLFLQAVLQTQAGRHAEAEAAYHKVIDLAPSDPKTLTDAQTNLGLLLAQDGNATDAIPLLTQAESADPKNPAPHLALGNLYTKVGNPRKAIDERMMALSLKPDDVQTRLLVADALLAQKRYREAAAQYDEAVMRQPGSAVVENARGASYELAGDLPKAQSAFLAALAADPRNAQAQNNLGVIYEKQGKKGQALAAYKKALKLNPMLTVARKNVARLTAK